MRISIEHETRYRYAGEATYCAQTLKLTPAPYDGLEVIEWAVSSEPAGDVVETTDGFGNHAHLVTIREPHSTISIGARGTVEVEDRHGVVKGLAENVPPRIYLKQTTLTTANAEIMALARSIEQQETLPRLHAVMMLIRNEVDYVLDVTDAETPASAALAARRGVCQDHAHIMIAAARSIGIPARYVTGYLLTGGVAPSAASHAWAEAWVEGLGWVGFDVANRICPTDCYVRLASALDANYAAPIRGFRRGGEAATMEVEVRVQQQSSQQ
jgi:transglutaminase-like putative cysteine protease